MKKILLILAVFALASPTMAAVSVSVVNNGDCTGDITYSMAGESGDQRIRAWALTVTVDGGAVITAVTPAVAGENQGFGFFPGTIVIVGDVILDPNTPVAPNDFPGATGTGLGTDTVILEMGSLHVDSNFPPDTDTLATIEVDQACNVTITAEVTYRGGIVREDASEVIGATLPTNAPITCEVVVDCDGDLDGNTAVNLNDIINIINYWNLNKNAFGVVPPSHPNWDPKYDLDLSGAVNLNDIIKLINYWNPNKNLFELIPCPGPGFTP